MKRRTPPRAPRTPRRRLAVSARQSRELVKFAGILEIRPGNFLEWVLGDLLESFRDPSNGMLVTFAEEVIPHDTPKDAERVKTRAAAWLERRKAVTDRRDGKEGSAS